ncbi:MAG: hypothetical protein ACLRQF_00200 [Thomasclavelia ramosa]
MTIITEIELKDGTIELCLSYALAKLVVPYIVASIVIALLPFTSTFIYST